MFTLEVLYLVTEVFIAWSIAVHSSQFSYVSKKYWGLQTVVLVISNVLLFHTLHRLRVLRQFLNKVEKCVFTARYFSVINMAVVPADCQASSPTLTLPTPQPPLLCVDNTAPPFRKPTYLEQFAIVISVTLFLVCNPRFPNFLLF